MKFFKIFMMVAAFIIFSPICSWATSTPVENSYFINLDNIAQVTCIDSQNHRVSGTGTVIAKNRILTANHVIYGTVSCKVGNIPARIISAYPELDMAILEGDLGGHTSITQISCDGFVKGNLYFGIGFSYGQDFAVTKLFAIGKYAKMDAVEEYPFTVEHFGALLGLGFKGMSGGPIIDLDGKIVGILNVSNEGTYVLSRSLSDTPLCTALIEK